MKIKFGNLADIMVGIKEIEVEGKSLTEIFDNLSKIVGKRVSLKIDTKEENVYLVVEENGKTRKNWVVALYNGINVLDIDPNAVQNGELVVFVPVSGG
ncbi:hypothetical protein [Pseudothermotoga thermarum]|uniref:MoaD family protein n=1 Tax=Pseudothermotoga thermarum DSM 5069 TaxID=688269 RepID=F7YVX2_9THEM|nr:hypothetical protein [Pseudothermotoga thermarum]AEH51794.1 hypothetical protein Theth_1750 [Pseudothermotoga thermarum DSM 5069]